MTKLEQARIAVAELVRMGFNLATEQKALIPLATREDNLDPRDYFDLGVIWSCIYLEQEVPMRFEAVMPFTQALNLIVEVICSKEK